MITSTISGISTCKKKKKGRKTRKLLIPKLAKELIVSSKVWFIFGSNPGVHWFYLTLLGGNFYLELNWNLPLQLFQESQSLCLKDYCVWPKPTNKICKKIVYFHERVHISWGEVTTCNLFNWQSTFLSTLTTTTSTKVTASKNNDH